MENKAGFHLPFVLIQEPAVYHDMLTDHQFSGLAIHRAGIIPQEEDHGLGFKIFLFGKNPIHPVLRAYEEISRIHGIRIGNLSKCNIGLDNFFEGRFFIENLAKSAVKIGEFICVTGKRTFFTLFFQVWKFKLFSEDLAQIIRI